MGKVNFSRLGHKRSAPAETIVEPRSLFRALPEKASWLPYLRGPQEDVLAAWHERRDERDLVVKLNTGGGKSLVGLLIARSWLNEGIRPVAYLVPDEFLTHQVIARAGEADIAVTNDPKSPDYQQGRAVLVGTFAKLFNGRSVFGVGGSVFKHATYGLGGIVVDDAHACIAQLDQLFRICIDSESEAYGELLALFADDLKSQSPNGLKDLQASRRTALQEVPYWSWQDRQDKVMEILHPLSDGELKWSWPLVVDSLPLCTAVFTSAALEIYPPLHPTDTLLGFSQAKRHVYLTATLADDSVLVRQFGASSESISRPIVPFNAGDIGDRMILLPQELVPEATDEEVRDLVLDLAEEQNVVVIVPSHARARWWQNDAAMVLDRENIHEGVEQLRDNPAIGLVVLVNRYDGVDLPDDACHILVLDGLPEALDGPERLTQVRLAGSDALLARQIQRLEQGMGRATRSNEDHAVVLLLGSRLAERLNAPGARDYFSPATRTQLDIAADTANELEVDKLDDLHDVIGQCLDRDRSWVAYSKGALAELSYDMPDISSYAETERRAFDLALRGDYSSAVKEQQAAVRKIPKDPATQALQKQRLASYTNFFDRAGAQQIQKAANTANRMLIRPLAGVQYERLQAATRPQGDQASSLLQSKYSSGNQLLVGFNALVQDLDWGPDTGRFEQALQDLAEHIGHAGQRPDDNLDRGPDGLWALRDGRFYVIEAKSGADFGHRVYKDDAKQLSNAMDWFRELYPNSEAVPILIHPEAKFDSRAAIPNGCRVITTERLSRLRDSLLEMAVGLSTNDAFRDPARVTSLLTDHSFSAAAFVNSFTAKGSHKNG